MMSMIFEMVGITPEQIAVLQASPSLANDVAVVAGHDNSKRDDDERFEHLSPERRAEEELRLRERESDPSFLEAMKEIAQARERLASLGPIEPALDLQKSWHILHYVLTGDIAPVGSPADALLTGEDIGEDTIGYGPPRLHTAEATQQFAKFLSAQSAEQLSARANFQEMTRAGVYSIPMGSGAEAEFEGGIAREISYYFPLLRDYVSSMAGKGSGLLMWIT